MSAFIVAGVELHIAFSLWLLPLAGVGHYFGLKMHERLIGSSATEFRRILGVLMIGVTVLGLWQSFGTLFLVSVYFPQPTDAVDSPYVKEYCVNRHLLN